MDLVALILVFLSPVLPAYFITKANPSMRPTAIFATLIGTALIPVAFLFIMSQQADGITRAVALYVVPSFLILTLITAAIGIHLGKTK
ncbi:MAG: hypothetical protein AAFW97_12860 [Pseudomonadota bacterium]